jgi:hypothetical protein
MCVHIHVMGDSIWLTLYVASSACRFDENILYFTCVNPRAQNCAFWMTIK